MSLALRSRLGIYRRMFGLAGRGEVVHQQINLLGTVGTSQQVRHGSAWLNSLGIGQILFQPAHPHTRTDLAQVGAGFGTRGRGIRHGMATNAIQFGEQDAASLGRILPFAMEPVKTGNNRRRRLQRNTKQRSGQQCRNTEKTHKTTPRLKMR